jgi:hypothetical protein
VYRSSAVDKVDSAVSIVIWPRTGHSKLCILTLELREPDKKSPAIRFSAHAIVTAPSFSCGIVTSRRNEPFGSFLRSSRSNLSSNNTTPPGFVPHVSSLHISLRLPPEQLPQSPLFIIVNELVKLTLLALKHPPHVILRLEERALIPRLVTSQETAEMCMKED